MSHIKSQLGMRRIGMLIAGLLPLSAMGYCAGQIASPIMISISLPQNSFRIGQPIVVHVALKNTSNEQITVARANGPQQAQFNYQIILKDPAGHQVALNSPKQVGTMHPPTAWSNIGYPLEPNEQLEEDCVITDLFMLKAPGRYTVEFTRARPNDPSKLVHSNRFIFTVTR